MSKADELYRKTCLDILENGFYDTDLEVRPRWADGTPAHTVKKFGVVNRYNLKEEFPIMTLRRTYWKSALDELLWIWQKKSNRIEDLGSHVWMPLRKSRSMKPTSWHGPFTLDTMAFPPICRTRTHPRVITMRQFQLSRSSCPILPECGICWIRGPRLWMG